MATDNFDYDPLRNPQVDYERADLSARGILLFLAGLLICCVFIDLVIWGMFRFLGKSEGLFAQGHPNPMETAQKMPTPADHRSVLQNAPGVNTLVFPEPRLQTNDVLDMKQFLEGEHKVLYPEQPFVDQTGALHIPISEAMKLIEQRGLPVRPSTPPPNFSTSEQAANATMLNMEANSYPADASKPKTGSATDDKPQQ